jgi:8-oxo-dGTP pyrophosphatase MutT (NUDIX family)
MNDEREAIPRPAARVLLCDGEGRILMFRARLAGREFWITPGGGLNDGETYVEAAARELWEETGLTLGEAVLCCVWTRSHEFEFRGRLIDQREQYFLLRVSAAPEITYENWEEQERNDLLEHRWWSAEEIEASDEVFAPRELGRLLAELLRDGVPAEPFDAGL